MKKSGSEVAIGRGDGYRYIGIKPPLDTAEVDALKDSGAIHSQAIVQRIETSVNCSLLTLAEASDERAHMAAATIAESLKAIRNEPVRMSDQIVPLSGHKSTPFNPITD